MADLRMLVHAKMFASSKAWKKVPAYISTYTVSEIKRHKDIHLEIKCNKKVAEMLTFEL